MSLDRDDDCETCEPEPMSAVDPPPAYRPKATRGCDVLLCAKEMRQCEMQSKG